jgi:outer membrane protein assembly factor BamE
MRIRSALILLLSAPLLAACFLKPHKIDVQQGNFLDQEAVSKLKPDMTRSQVRFLLGTPLVADPFHPERWDYLYIDRKAGKLKERKRLTLIFEGDQLKRALSDFSVPTGNLPTDQTAAKGR